MNFKEDINVLDRNRLLAMEEFLREAQSEFTDDQMDVFDTVGLDPSKVATAYVLHVDPLPKGRFLTDLRAKVGKMAKGSGLSKRQARAVLNVWRDATLGITSKDRFDGVGLDPALNGHFKCDRCEHVSENLADHITHKVDLHDYEIEFGSVEQAMVAPVAVIDNPKETGIDFSMLPNGRYGVPDPSAVSNGGFRFFTVNRLKRPTHYNRKFTYGKILSGSEILPIGTITVREWSSDRKELCGVQRPDHSYAGNYASKLEYAMANSEAAAMLFAVLKTRCGICGKFLTTAESRAAYIGPECEKQHGDLASYVEAHGKAAAERRVMALA